MVQFNTSKRLVKTSVLINKKLVTFGIHVDGPALCKCMCSRESLISIKDLLFFLRYFKKYLYLLDRQPELFTVKII